MDIERLSWDTLKAKVISNSKSQVDEMDEILTDTHLDTRFITSILINVTVQK